MTIKTIQLNDDAFKLASGILFVSLFASAALQVSNWSMFATLRVSPLIIGIMMGIGYGNTLRHHLPQQWVPGIIFSSSNLLRLAVIMYGFRLTIQDIASVGMTGILTDVIIVSITFVGGTIIGIKVLGLPRRLAILTAVGSSICGAAAILGTEPVVRAKPYESSIAVGTVVIFGTISMFLYPLLFKSGFLNLSQQTYGLWVGSTMHEVAHAVAAGNAVSPEAGNIAVIVKMLRVILIAPLLVGVGLWITKFPDPKETETEDNNCHKKTFPWFAILFIVCVGINSLKIIPSNIVSIINSLDIFFLTMAMCALGMETSIEKAKVVGPKPFILAGILAIWLMTGGYWIAKVMTAINL
ncbi:YeiH family protein [Desulfovibrio sp. UCD-KL4C]|uniref:YeiH family protein n=1 Tax=Desulfovibrio sp. UCD-KL4C TaxID=2578120 RepID=UPI0025C65D13|nr:YeiH family protein [Desulfovibrio sp. UCD-KL4C]